MSKNRFYHFRQNNSSGYFIHTFDVGPLVIIEAGSVKQANKKAEELGLFRLPGCSCCGPRFRRATIDNEHADYNAAVSWLPLGFSRETDVRFYPVYETG